MNLDSDKRSLSEPAFPKSLKIAVGLFVVLAVIGGGLKLWTHGLGTGGSIAPGTPWDAQPAYMAHFTSLGKYGRIEPVRIVDPKGAEFSAIGFSPSVHPDSVLCQTANALGPHNFSSFADPYPSYIRGRLEGLHANHPHYFYPEAMLADYYRSIGNQAGEQKMWDAAFRDAPCVVVGQAQLNNGEPIAGLRCDIDVTEYDGLASNARPLADLYYRVVTDKDGLFRLPCDRAYLSFRVSGWTMGGVISPKVNALLGHGSLFSSLQTDERFVVGGKIGAVKPIVLRPNLVVQASGGKLSTDQDHPATIPGTSCIFSWKPYPGATKYQLNLERVVYVNGHFSSATSIGTDSALFIGIPATQQTLDFRGSKPTFRSDGGYELSINAVDDAGRDVARSDSYYFHCPDALLPIRTIADADHILPAGCTAVSLTRMGRTTTIIATKLKGSILSWTSSHFIIGKMDFKDLPSTPADVQAGRERMEIAIQDSP